MQRLWPGAAAALASAILFGASTPLAKLLLGNVEPWLLAALLYLGAGAGLLAIRVARKLIGSPPEPGLHARDIPWLIAIVFSGGVIGPVLLMFGLARTGAATASLLLTLEGLATMAIAWLVYGENANRRIVVGAGAILAGAAVLAWPSQGVALNFGALLIAAACLAWAIDNNLTRRLSYTDPVQLAMVKGLGAGATNAAIALTFGAPLPGMSVVAGSLAVGCLGYGLSLALFVVGLRHLGAARTAAYFGTAPFVGALIAVAFFGEPLTTSLIAGGALIAAGIWIHLTERHEHPHVHEPIAHEHLHLHDEHHKHAHRPDEQPAAPHSHLHVHERLAHRHPHYPDSHHRHGHG